MTNVVTVYILDEDENLAGTDNTIIGKYEDVMIPDGQSQEVTMLKLALAGKIKEDLDAHNKKRAEIVNKKTLERTGVKVFLEPIEIDDKSVTIKFK